MQCMPLLLPEVMGTRLVKQKCIAADPNVIPVLCTQKCRSTSILCIGDESSHIELRACTVCELALHKEFYLTTDKVSVLQTGEEEYPAGKQLGKNVIVACSQSYDQALKLASTNLAETVFELDCLETPRIGTYSGMWHIYALSSVLRTPLLSIYPTIDIEMDSINRSLRLNV